MALAASLGRLLQINSGRLIQLAPVVGSSVQGTAISTSCSLRQAAVPEPVQPEFAPQAVDWRQNLGVVRNDWT